MCKEEWKIFPVYKPPPVYKPRAYIRGGPLSGEIRYWKDQPTTQNKNQTSYTPVRPPCQKGRNLRSRGPSGLVYSPVRLRGGDQVVGQNHSRSAHTHILSHSFTHSHSQSIRSVTHSITRSGILSNTWIRRTTISMNTEWLYFGRTLRIIRLWYRTWYQQQESRYIQGGTGWRTCARRHYREDSLWDWCTAQITNAQTNKQRLRAPQRERAQPPPLHPRTFEWKCPHFHSIIKINR